MSYEVHLQSILIMAGCTRNNASYYNSPTLKIERSKLCDQGLKQLYDQFHVQATMRTNFKFVY